MRSLSYCVGDWQHKEHMVMTRDLKPRDEGCRYIYENGQYIWRQYRKVNAKQAEYQDKTREEILKYLCPLCMVVREKTKKYLY